MRKTREAAIFVHRDDRFLVAKRSHGGHWNVIAGQVEDGETFEEGAARELQEESGLVAPLRQVGEPRRYEIELATRHLYAPGEDTVTVVAFAAEAPHGWEPTLNHEHTEYRWCRVDEAQALLHWPEMRASLAEVSARSTPRRSPGPRR